MSAYASSTSAPMPTQTSTSTPRLLLIALFSILSLISIENNNRVCCQQTSSVGVNPNSLTQVDTYKLTGNPTVSHQTLASHHSYPKPRPLAIQPKQHHYSYEVNGKPHLLLPPFNNMKDSRAAYAGYLEEGVAAAGSSQQALTRLPAPPRPLVPAPIIIHPPPPPPPLPLPPLPMPAPPSTQIASDEFEDASSTQDYNLIEGKQYHESVSSRCLRSTILADPSVVEPSFVFVKPFSEVKLNATANLATIKQLTHFDIHSKTVILIHGFTQSYPETDWLRRVRALFEMHTHLKKFNLIILDWKTGASNPYPRAAAMTSVIGSYLANFMQKLIALGADRLSFHLIGHSLGSHVAGFAGRRLHPPIGRITALDPAGPCFGKLYSNSVQDRLNADDAFEVDVYHYDDDFLGLSGQHGQFDIYVNGGSKQPGATDNFNSMVGALVTVVFGRKKVLSESHTRSIQVAMADLELSNKCQLIAYECSDYKSFKAGHCGTCDIYNNQCFSMSFAFQYRHQLSDYLRDSPLRSSPPPGKKLFISTKGNDPYCLFHDQILVRFEPNGQSSTTDLLSTNLSNENSKYDIYVQLYDELDSYTNVTINNEYDKNTYSYLMLSDNIRRRTLSAWVQVKKSNSDKIIPMSSANYDLNKQTNLATKTVKIYAIDINHMSNIKFDARRALSSRLCPLAKQPTGAILTGNGRSDDTTYEYQLFSECPMPPFALQQQAYGHQHHLQTGGSGNRY